MPASASLPRPLAIHSPLPRSPGLRLRRARTGAGIQPSSFSPPPPPPARPGPRPAPRPPARLRAPAAPPAFSGWERAGGQRAARTQTAAGGRAPRGPAGSSASGGARGEGGRARPTGARGQGEGSDGGSRPPPSHSSGTISPRCFTRTPPPPFWVRCGCRSNTGPGGTGLLSVTERWRLHKGGRSPSPAGEGCPAALPLRPFRPLHGGGSRVKGGLRRHSLSTGVSAELPRGQSYFSISARNVTSHGASLLSSRNVTAVPRDEAARQSDLKQNLRSSRAEVCITFRVIRNLWKHLTFNFVSVEHIFS